MTTFKHTVVVSTCELRNMFNLRTVELVAARDRLERVTARSYDLVEENRKLKKRLATKKSLEYELCKFSGGDGK